MPQENFRIMSATERFIAWCKQEQASLEQQLALMEAGKVRTGEDIGAGWIDTTADSIERTKARLAELHDLLTEAGKATVVKPNDL
jgi:predicted transcriptional regulator